MTNFQKALPADVITGGYIDAIKHKNEKNSFNQTV